MKFIQTLKNIWKIEELKNRILVTLGLLLVYRFGAQVVLPGIDADQLGQFSGNFAGGGIGGLLDAFTGGAFSNASIFALGIMPYISASIVVQLMGIGIRINIPILLYICYYLSYGNNICNVAR